MTAQNDKPTQQFMDGLWESVKSRAEAMAPVVGSGAGGKTLNSREIDMLWAEKHLSPAQVEDLWRIGRTPESIARGEKPLTVEEISMREHGNRERLMKSGGRIEPAQWIAWANRQAQRAQDQQNAQQSPAQPLVATSPSGGGY